MSPLTNGLLSASLLFAAALPAQGEVDPHTQANKGSSAWMLQELRCSFKMVMQGREIERSQTTKRTLHVEVEDIGGDGNLIVAVTIARVQGQLDLPREGQGAFDYDSTNDAQRAGGRGLQQRASAGAGMKFVATVAPNGVVLALGDGAAAIVAAARGPGNMHELTDLSLRQLVVDVVGFLPHRRTAAGANWECEGIDSLGRLVTRQKLALNLSDVAPETFTIEGKGKVDLALDPMLRDIEKSDERDKEIVRQQLKSAKVENGTVVCSQTTSRTDGFVLESAYTMELDLVTSLPPTEDVVTHMKMVRTIARTTAEQAKAKPAKAEAGKSAGK